MIAYSTCSQLGYMMVGHSLGHYALAVSHLMTHACFKAALFLCAGAVIHASEDQDMRRYGGLQLMPSAAIVASASLAGWPLLSGFYTKDGILEVSWTSMQAVADVANTGMLIVVCLTSCYSFKLSFLADASAFSLVHQGVGALRSAATASWPAATCSLILRSLILRSFVS